MSQTIARSRGDYPFTVEPVEYRSQGPDWPPNSSATSTRPTVVLVHGAWHGPWCWTELRYELGRLGWRTVAVQLPSASKAVCEPLPGLHDDTVAVSTAMKTAAANSGGPVVVLAHSYGGAPATAAAAQHPELVARLVYLAAYIPRAGENLYDIHGLVTPTADEGTIPVPADPVTMLYQDADPATAAWAAERLVPQTVRSWVERLPPAPGTEVATTYLVCDHDQALPPVLQEQFAARIRANAGDVRHLASGHSPFLSQPDTLAGVLDQALAHLDA